MNVSLHLLVSIGGYLGAVLLLASFAASSTGHLSATSRRYHGANAVGGAALMVSCVAQAAWPSASVNVVWLGISALTLIRAAQVRARAAAAPVVVPLPVDAPTEVPTDAPTDALTDASTDVLIAVADSSEWALPSVA